MDPFNPALRVNVGSIYYMAQNYDLAVRFYTDSINLKPDYINGYYNLAVALRDKGDLQNAQLVAEQAVALLRKDLNSEENNRASELLAKFHGLLVERTINTNVNIDEQKLEDEADEVINNIKYSKTIKPKDKQTQIDKDKKDILIPIDSSNHIDDTKKSDYVVLDEQGKVCS